MIKPGDKVYFSMDLYYYWDKEHDVPITNNGIKLLAGEVVTVSDKVDSSGNPSFLSGNVYRYFIESDAIKLKEDGEISMIDINKEKVTITKEQSEWLESILKRQPEWYNINQILTRVMTYYTDAKYSDKRIEGFASTECALAVINGYDVEKTPEERLVEYYNTRLKHANSGMLTSKGNVEGIKQTLKILGIEVEGINK